MNLGHLGRTQTSKVPYLDNFGGESIRLQRLRIPYPGLGVKHLQS